MGFFNRNKNMQAEAQAERNYKLNLDYANQSSSVIAELFELLVESDDSGTTDFAKLHSDDCIVTTQHYGDIGCVKMLFSCAKSGKPELIRACITPGVSPNE